MSRLGTQLPTREPNIRFQLETQHNPTRTLDSWLQPRTPTRDMTTTQTQDLDYRFKTKFPNLSRDITPDTNSRPKLDADRKLMFRLQSITQNKIEITINTQNKIEIRLLTRLKIQILTSTLYLTHDPHSVQKNIFEKNTIFSVMPNIPKRRRRKDVIWEYFFQQGYIIHTKYKFDRIFYPFTPNPFLTQPYPI